MEKKDESGGMIGSMSEDSNNPTYSTFFGNVIDSPGGGYQPSPGYSSKTMAGLAGFAGGPIPGLITTGISLGMGIFDYYANKRREREAAEKEERRYKEYLTENKRRYDADMAMQKEMMKQNKMLNLAQMNQNMIAHKDAIEGQNYKRYQDLQSRLDGMLNTSAYRNKFQSIWGG